MNPGSLITAFKRTLRADVNSKLIKQLAVKERYLQNLIDKFERSLSSFEKSRMYEQEYLKEVEVQNEAKSFCQAEVVAGEGGFLMDRNGDLFWEIKKLPEFAEIKNVASEQTKEMPPSAHTKTMVGESGERRLQQ
ncbi:UNVERIFIED_CONTAM: hypothetical protein HDU68_000237 [Siphonaria sp. JEL0065]|nr:hypothetical protein HDU68_000237 [Siphonaria sp. JEL0065]